MEGNFVDAVELNGWIYALELKGNILYWMKIDSGGRIHEKIPIAEVSWRGFLKLAYFYINSPPILLTDGHHLYALWADVVRESRPQGSDDRPQNLSEERVVVLAKISANGSVLYRRTLSYKSKLDEACPEVGAVVGMDAVMSGDKIVISLQGNHCCLVFVDKEGNIVANVKNPVMALPGYFFCWSRLRSFDGRLYHLGGLSGLGFLDLFRNGSLVRELSFCLQRNNVENNLVRDVYLDNGELYVCGLAQGMEVDGAFITKLDINLEEDLNGLLWKALSQEGSIIEVDRLFRGG